MSSEPKTVLMCGGPADGTWRVIQGHVRDVEVLAADWNPAAGDDPAQPPATGFTTHRYSVVPVHILGRRLWVAVVIDAAYLANDDRAILKAVLNRDVAAHLGAYR